MPTRTSLSVPVSKGCTYCITGVFTDELDAPIPGANLATLTLTLYDRDTREVINNVADVNILNLGRGVVDGDGNLTLTLLPADATILTPRKQKEQHLVLLKWTYGVGASKSGAQEIEFTVVNIPKDVENGHMV